MESKEELRIDSILLAKVRELARTNSVLAKALGPVAQFRLVIDANFVIADLMHKIKYPERTTAVEELIQCTVFIVIAPRWLETELVQSAIPKTAAKRGIAPELLHAQWAEYSKLLLWDENAAAPPAWAEASVDPKDVPYVMTQWDKDACGVLSKDPHISKLGGTQLTLDFVLSARRYARTVVVSVGIRMSGMMIGMFTIGVLIETIKGIAAAFSRLPPIVQAIIIATLAVAILDPRSRAWLKDRAERIVEKLGPVLYIVGEAIVKGRATIESSQADATKHLTDAHGHLATAASIASPLVAIPLRRRRRKAIMK